MVRTRFAPSPTGYLHIGGVRTALFNWLFARHHGGQFILRIDDTDQQRNVQEALQPILDGLRWLSIDWDEGPDVGGPHQPYFQSQRSDRYRAAVAELLKCGAAYWDYARPEELQAQRAAAEREGQPFVYNRQWMAETAEERVRFEAEGRQGVVRLKMPRDGHVVIQDHIRGEVAFRWAAEQDHVIQRADGSVLYHLATVIDDHDFQVTHVIRAEEHLSNTPRQVFIAQALGYPLPEWAHLPVVAEPGSRTKLSKRKLDKYLKNRDFYHLTERGRRVARRLGWNVNSETFNPVITDFYQKIGFLPDAVCNYLLLLGWSFDERTEYFTREEMVRCFTLPRVNKAPASFDPAKLLAFQQHYMNQLPVKQKVPLVLSFLQQAGLVGVPLACEIGPYVAKIVAAAGERLVLASDILDYEEFFLPDEQVSFDPKAFDKRLRSDPTGCRLLDRFRSQVACIQPFTAERIEQSLREFVVQAEVGIGQVIHALRVAITGKSVGFGLFEAMEILGPERCGARIDRALKLAP